MRSAMTVRNSLHQLRGSFGHLLRRGRRPPPGWRSRARSCSIAAIDSHRAADRHVLSDHERRFLLTRRVGHLATADSRAIPHVVPVCFTISQGTLYITIDEKPKRVAGPEP